MTESQNENCFEASPVPGHVAADHPQLITTKRRQPLGEICSNEVILKKRQKSATNRSSIVSKYKSDVQRSWIDRTTTVSTWYNPDLQLKCKEIDPKNLPTGFTRTKDSKYQYNFTDPESEAKKKRYRPVAYRIPFLLQEGFNDAELTVSHLCHNNWCYNWDHHVLEILAINKARNGCPAGPYCRHKVKCITPGKFSDK
jgi:predicted FMN-binding regulatory protein PaiB